ncbi:hypothetical protein E2K93_13760 [Thalassotalea sp. HSM 43]|uniref:hypothetical protein n=1 Tax=Thalassotalea sp. HSM 43 TaxID=2552945 RepID=UPI001080EE9D|nr:hypothetical protein [Thalassotalea sp. HSM 43]QBY05376.1 hypothetical protein E2K93_13760 [Thalassotalea sp. HSM 43]
MKVLTSIFLFLVLTSCSTHSVKNSYNSEDLVGVWELKYDGVPPYWFSQIGFTKTGKKCVLSYEFNSRGEVEMTYYDNRYQVKDGHLYTYVDYSSTPYLRKGEVIKDRIDILKPDYFEVLMVLPFKGDTQEKHLRLDDISPEELCKIVDDFRKINAIS